MTDIPAPPSERRIWTPYQIYVVALILAVTVCNYLDRIVLGVLQEPIKHELHLSDAQLGLLTGPAFALFYSLSGIPAARLAERFNRATLLAAAITVWSGMTALCGLANNFVQLLLYRIGVGAGEGGCIPVTHSLLSDYFSPRQRGFVMSIVSMAPPFASILAPIVGGLVAENWGWRAAFFALGLPGIVLALLAHFTLKEPRAAAAATAKPPPKGNFIADCKWLMGNKAFVYIFVGGAFVGVANAGIAGFTISFLLRTHELTLSQAGGIVGMTGVAGLVGAMLGGLLADWFSGKRGRSYALVPALGSGLAAVCFATAFWVDDLRFTVPMLLAAAVAYNMKNGPIYAAVQNIVPSTMRATGAAIFMVGATVVGSTVGPLMTGVISDAIARSRFPEVLGSFSATCPGGRAPEGASEAIAAACAQSSAIGLQSALILMSVVFVISMGFLAMASRHIRLNTSGSGDEPAQASA
jgi:MFS family permease